MAAAWEDSDKDFLYCLAVPLLASYGALEAALSEILPFRIVSSQDLMPDPSTGWHFEKLMIFFRSREQVL